MTLYGSLSITEGHETEFQLKVPPLDINMERKKMCVSAAGKSKMHYEKRQAESRGHEKKSAIWENVRHGSIKPARATERARLRQTGYERWGAGQERWSVGNEWRSTVRLLNSELCREWILEGMLRAEMLHEIKTFSFSNLLRTISQVKEKRLKN